MSYSINGSKEHDQVWYMLPAKHKKDPPRVCFFLHGGGWKAEQPHSGFSDKTLISLGPLEPTNFISVMAIGKFSRIYLLPSNMDISCQGLWGVWNFLLTRIYTHTYIPFVFYNEMLLHMPVLCFRVSGNIKVMRSRLPYSLSISWLDIQLLPGSKSCFSNRE